MKQIIKRNSIALLSGSGVWTGIVSANISDIPNPLPNAVSGAIITALDVNDLVESVTALDKRILQDDAGNSEFTFSKKSDGTDRTATESVTVLDSGEIQIDAGQNVENFGNTSVVTKGWLNNEFADLKVPSFATLSDVPTPLETGQVVLIGSVLNVYNGTIWIAVNPL